MSKLQINYLLAIWTWTHYLMSLDLRFFICKICTLVYLCIYLLTITDVREPWRLNDLIHIKWSLKCLAQGEYSMKIGLFVAVFYDTVNAVLSKIMMKQKYLFLPYHWDTYSAELQKTSNFTQVINAINNQQLSTTIFIDPILFIWYNRSTLWLLIYLIYSKYLIYWPKCRIMNNMHFNSFFKSD